MQREQPKAGDRWGGWTLVRELSRTPHYGRRWLVRCRCGAECERTLRVDPGQYGCRTCANSLGAEKRRRDPRRHLQGVRAAAIRLGNVERLESADRELAVVEEQLAADAGNVDDLPDGW